jgi:hypothetical protein
MSEPIRQVDLLDVIERELLDVLAVCQRHGVLLFDGICDMCKRFSEGSGLADLVRLPNARRKAAARARLDAKWPAVVRPKKRARPEPKDPPEVPRAGAPKLRHCDECGAPYFSRCARCEP